MHAALAQQRVEKLIAAVRLVAGKERHPHPLDQGERGAELRISGELAHGFGLKDQREHRPGQGADDNRRVGGKAPVDQGQHQDQGQQQMQADIELDFQVAL